MYRDAFVFQSLFAEQKESQVRLLVEEQQALYAHQQKNIVKIGGEEVENNENIVPEVLLGGAAVLGKAALSIAEFLAPKIIDAFKAHYQKVNAPPPPSDKLKNMGVVVLKITQALCFVIVEGLLIWQYVVTNDPKIIAVAVITASLYLASLGESKTAKSIFEKEKEMIGSQGFTLGLSTAHPSLMQKAGITDAHIQNLARQSHNAKSSTIFQSCLPCLNNEEENPEIKSRGWFGRVTDTCGCCGLCNQCFDKNSSD